MIRKTSFLVERPLFRNRNHTEIPVKIHGYIFNLLSPAAASKLHDAETVRPYSLEYYPGNSNQKTDLLVVNTLNDLAEEIPAALMRAGQIIFEGSERPCRLQYSESVSYSEDRKDRLIDSDYLTIHFLSPTVYRNGDYCCWFDLDQITRNPRAKLEGTQNKVFDFEKPIMEQVRVVDFNLKSKPYILNRRVNGLTGDVKLSLKDAVNREGICELLSYCEFTGMGAKTALGMGTFKVE